ncbi:MAG: signal peptidase II [Armatimonadetes bacterium]|nr:signal peptidase II [Armatimonadota bacterium]
MRGLFFVLSGFALALDQTSKFWARAAAEGVEGRIFLVPWPGVFEFKLVFNEGIAFGMLRGLGVWLAPIGVIIAGGAAWYSLKHPQESRATHVTMALLAAGAVGNLIDRIAFGKVTDMLWVRAINFPVFNVADVCITAAGAMLALSAISELFHREEEAEDSPICHNGD